MSVISKLEFIKWVRKEKKFICNKCQEVLKFLSNNEELLSKVIFVGDVRSRKGKFSIEGYVEPPFLGLSEHKISDLGYEQFIYGYLDDKDRRKWSKDVRKFKRGIKENDFILVQLYYEGVESCSNYKSVMVEDPYLDIYMTHLINFSVYQHTLDKLNKQIDKALDERDRDKFNKCIKLKMTLQSLVEDMVVVKEYQQEEVF